MSEKIRKMGYAGIDETKFLADVHLGFIKKTLNHCNNGLAAEIVPGSSRDLNNLKWILAHFILSPFLHLVKIVFFLNQFLIICHSIFPSWAQYLWLASCVPGNILSTASECG